MATAKKFRKRWRVYSASDLGGGRQAGGYTSMWPTTKAEAEQIAAAERSKPYNVRVEVREEKDPTILQIANG